MNAQPSVADIKAALVEPVKEVMARYPTNRSAIMPALELAQEKFGIVDGTAYRAVAELLDVPEIWVFEVASFYTLFNRAELGKHHLQVCTNVPCMLRGAYDLLAHLKQLLSVDEGETTDDAQFTLSSVECLGGCGVAPVMMVNESHHENLTIQILDDLIVSLSDQSTEVTS